MYATSKRSYRGLKNGIDMANIVIAGLIFVLAVLSIFKVYREMVFFPAIFYLGAIMNIITGVKAILSARKLAGILSIVLGVIIIACAVYATFVFWI